MYKYNCETLWCVFHLAKSGLGKSSLLPDVLKEDFSHIRNWTERLYNLCWNGSYCMCVCASYPEMYVLNTNVCMCMHVKALYW